LAPNMPFLPSHEPPSAQLNSNALPHTLTPPKARMLDKEKAPLNPEVLDSHEPAKKSQPTGIIEVFRRWWFIPILLFALVEWLLHTWQTRTVMTDEDWADIRTYLQAETKPEDLIVLAPPWLDPVGRMHLGDNLMTEKRVARADESRFPRAFEVSLDNARLPFTRTWKQDHHQRIGPFHLRSFHNPEYQPILHDLVDHAQGTADRKHNTPDTGRASSLTEMDPSRLVKATPMRVQYVRSPRSVTV